MDVGALLRSAETRVQVTEVVISHDEKVILEIGDLEAGVRHE